MADCKRKTANLINVPALSGVRWAAQYPALLAAINSLPNGVYTMSILYELTSRNDTTDSSVCGWYIAKDSRVLSNIRLSWQTAQIGDVLTTVDTFTIDDNNRGAFTALYLYGCGINGIGPTGTAIVTNIMLNSGSTALPYEPYYIHSLRKLGTSTDTITTLPAVLYPTGTTATVGLKGNMSQIGTPTSTTPIQPSECGERTGNLFDKNATDTNNGYVVDGYLTSDGTIHTNNGYRTSEYIPILSNQKYITYAAGLNTPSVCFYDANKNYISGVNYAGRQYATFTTPSDAKYVRLSFRNVDGTIMFLNLGGTPLPYEPYGIKIPILNNSQTTPVYLGEVETTRRIRKLVLDGTESVSKDTGQDPTLYFLRYKHIQINSYCTHLRSVSSKPQSGEFSTVAQYDGYIFMNFGADIMNAQQSGNTIEGFKEYLATQYAAGTPVTVWYVLAEPTTGIVNEPLRKIGDYADTVSGITIPVTTGANTIDVDTTLKPSEVELTYTGWHDAQCKEYDGSQEGMNKLQQREYTAADELSNESTTNPSTITITYANKTIVPAIPSDVSSESAYQQWYIARTAYIGDDRYGYTADDRPCDYEHCQFFGSLKAGSYKLVCEAYVDVDHYPWVLRTHDNQNPYIALLTEDDQVLVKKSMNQAYAPTVDDPLFNGYATTTTKFYHEEYPFTVSADTSVGFISKIYPNYNSNVCTRFQIVKADVVAQPFTNTTYNISGVTCWEPYKDPYGAWT